MSYHVPKISIVEKKIDFFIFKNLSFKTDLNRKLLFFGLFFRKTDGIFFTKS